MVIELFKYTPLLDDAQSPKDTPETLIDVGCILTEIDHEYCSDSDDDGIDCDGILNEIPMEHLPVFPTPNYVNEQTSVSHDSNWIDTILILNNDGENEVMSDDNMAYSDPDLCDGNWWISPSYYDLDDPIEIIYLENITEFCV